MAPARKKQRLSNRSDSAVDAEQNAGPQPTQEINAHSQEKAVQQKRSLFVRSLPASTTSESLSDIFSDAYPVKHAVAVVDPATKECRGYGFVTFADAEDATRAKAQFNAHVLEGRKLRIEIAEPRHRNSDGVKESISKKSGEEVQQPPKLIVRNLPWSIKGSEQLTKLFMSYGKVKQAYVPRKGPGLMAGFGFVIMRGKKNAEKAIEGVNGKEVDGRTLAVDWAVEKDVYEDVVRAEDALEGETNAEDDTQVESLNSVSSGAEESDEDNLMDGAQQAADNSIDSDNEEDSSHQGDGTSSQADGKNGEEGIEDREASEDTSCTIFIRNLPFTCLDEELEDHFASFGGVRYARVVVDHETGRSKGTGFVCFYNKEDADACLRSAPAGSSTTQQKPSKDGTVSQHARSILQNEDVDPMGQYTLGSRVLQVSRAVNKSEAARLTNDGVNDRTRRDNDKRRLFLLSEGTISSKSKLWEQLSPSERAMREASAKQRKSLVESNPSLHLSLTRLSVRNLPRSVGSKELKELARQAVVGFATDVKSGLRQQLSAEELSRGGEEMKMAEKARKKAGKGLVKQAKVVFESTGGSKVSEGTGAGRSRGYGFIEYHTHRSALMSLRWLNGHAVGYQVQESKLSREEIQDRKKRLIVEFAIENAQVVMRRKDKEEKARARSLAVQQGLSADDGKSQGASPNARKTAEQPISRKRKRDEEKRGSAKSRATGARKTQNDLKRPVDEKLAKRNEIIGRKRALRRARQGAKS